MPEWSPDLTVDRQLAESLIADQFPELASLPVRELASGWDNAVFRVGGDARLTWAFRFPQRAVAVPGVEREIALLADIAPTVPVAVPTPTWVGAPSEDLGYPWPFFGAPFIDGVEVADAGLSSEARAALAAPLGRFLHALHAPGLAARLGPRLPVDPNRRTDMPYRVEMTRGRLRELAQAGLWTAPPSVRELLEEAGSLPAVPATAVVHGDLHVRHLLLRGGGLAGVIDWGDMGCADPSVDLAVAWFLLPPEARAAFFDAYGAVTAAQRLRAQLLALLLSATLALYARDRGLRSLERETLVALERVLADPR